MSTNGSTPESSRLTSPASLRGSPVSSKPGSPDVQSPSKSDRSLGNPDVWNATDDSDSDQEIMRRVNSRNVDSSDEEMELRESVSKTKKKRKAMIHSDSEDPDTPQDENQLQNNEKSSDEEETEKESENSGDKETNEVSSKQSAAAIDSDTSDEGVIDPYPVGGFQSKNASDSDEDIDGIMRDKRGRKRGKNTKTNLRRQSKKEIEEIHRESNRLLRESALNLPYHRPKTRTLDEFLNRKKNAPDIITDIKVNFGKVKVEEYEKMLEKREQIAKDFFAEQEENGYSSDSEDEDYDPNKSIDHGEVGTKVQDTEENDSGITCSRAQSSEDSGSNSDEDKVRNKEVDPSTTSHDINEKEEGTTLSVSEEFPVIKDSEDLEFSESLNLVLEPDSLPINMDEPEIDAEKIADFDDLQISATLSNETLLGNSQKSVNEVTISKTKRPSLAKRLETLGKRYNIEDLSKTLEEKKPTLGVGADNTEIVFDSDEEDALEKKKLELKNRFVKHVQANAAKLNNKKDENFDLHIVRKEKDQDGVERLKTETIEYKSKGSSNASPLINDTKPGLKHLVLKQALKDKIEEAKRLERKKQEELKKLENEEADDEAENNILDDDEEEELENSEEDDETDEEENKNEEEVKNKSAKKSLFVNDEAEEDNDEDDMVSLFLEEDDENDGNEMDKFGSAVKSSQYEKTESKNTSLSSLNSIQWSLSEPKYDLFDSQTQSLSSRKKLGFDSLIDESDPSVNDIDELAGLCSGQFQTQKQEPKSLIEQRSQTQSQLATPDTVILTQSQVNNQSNSTVVDENESDLPNEIPGSCKSSAASDDRERHSSYFYDSDDETDYCKPLVKKRSVLQFSDDEDEKIISEQDVKDAEDNDNQNDDEGNSDCELDDKNDDAGEDDNDEESDNEKEIQYDSEENEIVEEKPRFKGFKGKRGIRKEFLEHEAELSGSDLGSEDEDERGLNTFELEEGDYDDLDEDEVADQVGKIHQKRLLDEDKRDIRFLKEILFEDGELHSDQTRTRKFKWAGIDENEELERRNSDDEEGEEQNNSEEKRRLERLEREKWIQDSKTFEKDDDFENDPIFRVASKVIRKIERKESMMRQHSTEKQQRKQFQQSFKAPDTKLPLKSMNCNQKGSFLSRGEMTLQKLAAIAKSRDDVKCGSSAKNSTNFVFATLETSSSHRSELDENADKPSDKKRKVREAKVESSNKRQKFDRTIDENSVDTIFKLL